MSYGSLVNTLYDGNAEDFASQVQVGDGATFLFWSDRAAGTVVEVLDGGKTVGVKRDKATRVDKNGMSDAQRYEYERDETATTVYFTLRKNGRYVAKGQGMKNGQGVRLGVRDHYYDYSF